MSDNYELRLYDTTLLSFELTIGTHGVYETKITGLDKGG